VWVEESLVSGRHRIDDHKNDNECLRGHGCERARADFPMDLMPVEVEQVKPSVVNRDALLFVFDGLGTGAGVPRW